VVPFAVGIDALVAVIVPSVWLTVLIKVVLVPLAVGSDASKALIALDIAELIVVLKSEMFAEVWL
jgi:hypothetical protein